MVATLGEDTGAVLMDDVVIRFGSDTLTVKYHGEWQSPDEGLPRHRYIFTIESSERGIIRSHYLDMPPGYPYSLEDAARCVCAHLYYDEGWEDNNLKEWIEQHREQIGLETIYE